MVAVSTGTHRIIPPEKTLENIAPLFPAVGLTRIADVTHLDDIGIPVSQAVRPNAKTLSVSQGKGVSLHFAKVSAAMEAIELWHAEEFNSVAVVASVREIGPSLGYSPFRLPLQNRSLLSLDSRLSWVTARQLLSDKETHVPFGCVQLDFTDSRTWRPPLFRPTSNGLASGNNFDEALLHALYELLERDTLARVGEDWKRYRTGTSYIKGTSSELLDKYIQSEVSVGVYDFTRISHIPCFGARIWSRSFPSVFMGSGCHADPDIALSRALTEAAQSRLTAITGSRDDISPQMYEWIKSSGKIKDPLAVEPELECEKSTNEYVAGLMSEEIEIASRVIEKRSGVLPVVVNMTQPGIGVSVVRVISPGLLAGGA
ncbi:YcaO-like family protein [Streptomyces sp. TX20-6-3]|uniref:YcaO-like family protein n=1 Tax=Streptomyces sp. TX20-6-3 TaxID=3028705 RepID=UPI0029A9449F|nr:YcaO-like family protein [Streptomyces sp. TX20-6-3]MDX2565390.1 YcaO-like family protein [Streptomyces sp. TX20-6-3]